MCCGTLLREVLMSIRSLYAAFAALVVAAPATLRAQEPEADFVKARQQFVAGQPRAAAQTLVISSLAVRQQVGRCRAEDVGTRLMDAEAALEKLASALQKGTVTSVKTLDQQLMQIDRVLAQHHIQLASALMARPRPSDIPVMAADINRAAFHFERSVTLDGHALAGEQASMVADVRALVKTIEATSALPQGAAAVVAAFEKMLGGNAVVGAR